MSIANGFKKIKEYIKGSDGKYYQKSVWTSAETVEMASGTNLETKISTMDTNISDANSAAATANTKASNAVTTANSADTTASNAQSTANTASTKADNRLATSEGGTTLSTGRVVITDSYGKATTSTVTSANLSNMSSNISTAMSNASTALSNSNARLATANSSTTLGTNKIVITDDYGKATVSTVSASALGDIATAKSDAATAKSDASTAKTNASTALSTANSASTTASSASSTASTALSNSNARLATSNGKTTLSTGKVVVTDNNGKATTSIDASYISNISSNVQTQLNNKASSTHNHDTVYAAKEHSHSGYQSTITGGASSITSDNLSSGYVLISNSNGKVAASSKITISNLNCLDGLVNNVQSALTEYEGLAAIGRNHVLYKTSGTEEIKSSPASIYDPNTTLEKGTWLIIGVLKLSGRLATGKRIRVGVGASTASASNTLLNEVSGPTGIIQCMNVVSSSGSTKVSMFADTDGSNVTAQWSSTPGQSTRIICLQISPYAWSI